MKGKLPIAICLFIFSLHCSAQTAHEQQEVEKAVPAGKHCTEIPGSFSHETISNSKALKALQSKKITRVELIYTRYKEDEHFDQNQLNEDRMYRLKQLLPRLKTDNPHIVWIEQTGAKTRAEAQQYFHGFRIYTDDVLQAPMAFKRVEQADPSNPFSMFDVDNAKGGTFTHPSGSTIHIPAYAVTDQNGKPVAGMYIFSYREYRNAAEMAFSGIPMEYKDKTGSYLFNSAGMYEIRGTQNGNTLKLAKEVTVDFNCTRKEEGINFYQLDDETGIWTVLRHDLLPRKKMTPEPDTPLATSQSVQARVKRDDPKLSYVKSIPYAIVTLDNETREAYRSLARKEPQKISESVAQDLTKEYRLKVNPEYVEALVQLIWQEYDVIYNNQGVLIDPENADSRMIEGSDKGHQYPNLVRGLNSDKFGVYNCDQIYRLANQTEVSPKYLNAATKKTIKDADILCLIDKDVNASFSFDPKRFTCNSKGKNIFLLFTTEGEIYVLQSEQDPKLDLSKKTPVFLMENITDQIKTSDDLKHYLSI